MRSREDAGDLTRLNDWSQLSSSVVSDCLDRSGAMHHGIKPLSGGRILGPAFTVSTSGGDNTQVHHAIPHCRPGDVLVVDAKGDESRAVWGEVLTRAALEVRISGVVVDGAIRDLDAIRSLEFPIFARSASPAGPLKGGEGTIGEPVSCGGLEVSKGDLVVGDADGVVVVPVQRTSEVLAMASERRSEEADWIRRIQEGETTVKILGLQNLGG